MLETMNYHLYILPKVTRLPVEWLGFRP